MKFIYHPPKIEYLNPVTPIERLVWFRWQRMEDAQRARKVYGGSVEVMQIGSAS